MRSVEVMLELMLLDAQVAVPSDVLAAARPLGASPAPDLPATSDTECRLRVLVSRAVGLPQVPVLGAGGEAGTLQPPAPFVVLKAARDAKHGAAVQGATRVAQRSCNPIWCAAAPSS
jgi:hypothetical protein